MDRLSVIIALVGFFALFSCEERNQDVVVSDVNELSSPYLTLDIQNSYLDPDNLTRTGFIGKLSDRSGLVKSYDVSVSLFRPSTGLRSDTVFVRSIKNSFGDFSITGTEIVSALGESMGPLEFRDELNFVASFSDGNLTWRADGPEANVGSGLFGSVIEEGQQPFLYTLYVGCEIKEPFTGKYELVPIEAIRNPFFGGGEFHFASTIVDVSKVGVFGRTWKTEYATFTVDFNIELICGKVEVPYTITGIGCGGPGINWIQADTLSTYNTNDDSYFEISIIENVYNGCGIGINPGTVLSMTKL